jgi:hypothetical protein
VMIRTEIKETHCISNDIDPVNDDREKWENFRTTIRIPVLSLTRYRAACRPKVTVTTVQEWSSGDVLYGGQMLARTVVGE